MERATRRSVRAIAATALAIAVVAPAATPAFAQAPQITTPYPAVAVAPGDSTTFPLTVRPQQAERVALAVEDVPEGWTATIRGGGFTVDAVYADPGEPPEVELEVEVPPEATDGATTVTVTATTEGGTTSLPIEIRVDAGAGTGATLETEVPALRGAADEMFTFDLTLNNDTASEARFALEAVGGPGTEDFTIDVHPSGEAQASSAVVDAGGTETIQVEVDPPDDAQAGQYPIAVRAVAGDEEAVAELGLEITGNFAMEFSTADQRLNARAQAGSPTTLDLVVTNTGSSPLTAVTFSATPPSGWDVTFEPATLETVEPGAQGTARATITAAGNAIAGDYSLTIDANSADVNDSIEVRTTVETSPLWGFVGIALIVAVGAGLVWVFRQYGRR
jgi:uncharacterized repeat protein (TIGR01451 family)